MAAGEPEIGTLLASRGRRRELAAGEVLFRQGDRSRRVYECIKGRIRLVVAATAGRELLIDMALPGDVFGHLSALDGHGRSSTAMAVVPTVVTEVEGDDYLDALRANPEVLMVSVARLTRQLRQANSRICAGETDTVLSRTAHLLLELRERFARLSPGDQAVEIPLTQTELADWLGATREATSRSLGELRSAGAITTGRGRIVLVDATRIEPFVAW